jgi:hypothetical protein
MTHRLLEQGKETLNGNKCDFIKSTIRVWIKHSKGRENEFTVNRAMLAVQLLETSRLLAFRFRCITLVVLTPGISDQWKEDVISFKRTQSPASRPLQVNKAKPASLVLTVLSHRSMTSAHCTELLPGSSFRMSALQPWIGAFQPHLQSRSEHQIATE